MEVQNIQMTATVPEDLQISLGKLKDSGVLASSTGLIDTDTDGKAQDPGLTLNYWSNTADISAYYTLGKIIPASSTTGQTIYFTPDATGVGKTVKSDGSGAQFIAANSGLTAVADNGSGTYMTTLHAKESKSDTWGQSGSGYTPSTLYSVTKDDGYYVDIPVWLRTSSNTAVPLKVEAYVKDNNSSVIGDASGTAVLYKAARVAIINDTGVSTSNIIGLKADSYTGTSVVDYYGTAAESGAVPNGAVNKAGYLADDTYAGITPYNDGTVVTVAGSGNDEYGEASLVYIRVWLEGEDPECWNANAGQNFSINLKFTKNE
ncbi:hypothetical protein SAMN04487934_103173 [Eubacterium ruminantium]|nr:hypothetical protein SAMN04487934_103173 [Eubacterium ruminantium]